MEKICPYNNMVDCEDPKCERCGWYPPVAKARIRELTGGVVKYKVPFTGYCEVFAATPEEAAEKAEDIQQQFFAHYDYGDPVCLEKEE
jgi:hypothetical protein